MWGTYCSLLFAIQFSFSGEGKGLVFHFPTLGLSVVSKAGQNIFHILFSYFESFSLDTEPGTLPVLKIPLRAGGLC